MSKWIEKDGWLYDEQGSVVASVYNHAPYVLNTIRSDR